MTVKSRSNLAVSTRAARHPVYKTRAVFWGEVHDGPKLLYGIGPFRKKPEALHAALLWANQQSLPGMDPATAPLITRLDEASASPQKPCNIGLFSDDATQIDLLDVIARR